MQPLGPTDLNTEELPRQRRVLSSETLVLLDVDAEHLDDCLEQVLEALSSTEMEDQHGEEIGSSLRRHGRGGPEAFENGVAIIHGRLRTQGPMIQVLVRFSTPMELDDRHEPCDFLWILLSEEVTHPHIDTAVEFLRLMAHPEVHARARSAESPRDLATIYELALEEELEHTHASPELERTGSLFGGIRRDLGRRLPHYVSDFTDGLSGKSFASVLFMFFAVLAPSVAFGGLLAVLTDGTIGVVETLVATAFAGVVYALFSGQPLTILGSTGPVAIFLGMLYAGTVALGLPFLPTFFWVGIWTSFFLFVLAATDASSWIRFFTRFTDDIFAALIAFIFIVEALTDISSVFFEDVAHDTALLSLILAVGTFLIATWLSNFRRSPYLRSRVREFLADFGPAIALAGMTGVALALHAVDLETLAVPESFGTTSGRAWIVDPTEAPRWVWIGAALPALVSAILMYLDQNITVRLVNSPDNKLKKGAAFHLDLAIIAGLVGILSVFGLPWTVAATVRSLNHVRSLSNVETVGADSGHPQEVVTSVVETRLTGLVVHLLVGGSLLFLGLLSQVPMSVLFGLFLFMGVASTKGNQLFERLRLWIMDPAHYPPTYYLRAVPTKTVHIYTAIQALALGVLWAVKSSPLGLLFPLFIALLVPVRLLMGRWFKAEHLALLDAEEAPEEEIYREAG